MAEFDTATELVDAARKMRDAGYKKTDAFTPFPLHEIDEALGIRRSILPVLVFFGGITGMLTGIGLQVFVHYIDYPMNVGGRPFISIPSMVPPTFGLSIFPVCKALFSFSSPRATVPSGSSLEARLSLKNSLFL